LTEGIFKTMKILRPEVLKCVKYNVPGKHGATDLIDDLFLMSFNLTDEELNFVCANASVEEYDLLVEAVSGADDSLQLFTKIRKALEVRNKYMEIYK
jgi:hypothetical protein